MTAFASCQAQYDWGSLTWDIRSVNHRYLELDFRLAETLRDLEMPLRQRLRKYLHRGRQACTLQTELENLTTHLDIDIELAQQYIDAGENIAKLINSPAPRYPLDILNRPGVLKNDRPDPEALKTASVKLYDLTIRHLVDTREREGSKLANIISLRLEDVSTFVERVRNILPELIGARRRQLQNKLAEFGSQLNKDRLEQELVYLVQKTDVEEELGCLEVNISKIGRALQSSNPMRRRIDFFVQEASREANTLSSKSFASSTTHSAIEIKVLIEQVREQIQNLE
jgi:uncharacterized protein (TIGR00255 family)